MNHVTSRRPVALTSLGAATLLTLMFGCGVKVTSGDDDTTQPVESATPPSPTPEPEPSITPPTIEIIAEPTSLKFGQVEISESKTLTVGFFNRSDQTFLIKYVQIYQTIEYFAAGAPSSTVLEPGKNVTVDVTFRPAQTGNYKASLTLVTEEAVAPTVAMTASGIPYDPTNDSPTPTPGP